MKKIIKYMAASALCMAAAVSCLALSGCWGDYMDSNRCVARDTNHTFTRAIIRYGSSNEVVQVAAWQDYQNSDSIQLWIKDDKAKNKVRVIYTHLNNVILENPDPACPPSMNKFF